MKKILALVLVVTLSLSVTGCKKKDTSPAAQFDPYANPVQIWMSGNEEEKKFLQAMGREMVAAEQLQGLQFRVVNFPDEASLHENIANKMAEGKGPDIVYTTGDWIANNIGKLKPIVNDETFKPNDYRRTFVRAANETLIHDEKIYGIPLAVDSLGVYYNTEHTLDRLPDRNTPGKHWLQFQEDVAKLTKTDNSFERFKVAGVSIGRSDNMHYAFDILENIMIQQDVNFVSPDQSSLEFHTTTGISERGGQLNLGVDSVNYYTSYADPRFKHNSWGEFMAQNAGSYKNFETFAAGRLSMVFGYARDWETIEDAIEERESRSLFHVDEDNVRVHYFPQNSGLNAQLQARKLIGKVHALAVSKDTTYKTVTWRYLKFVAGKENLQTFHDETNLPPSRVDLIGAQQQDPRKQVFATQAKFAKSNILPISKKELAAAFEQMIQDLNDGKGSAGQLLQEIGNRFNLKLREKQRIEREIKRKTPEEQAAGGQRPEGAQ